MKTENKNMRIMEPGNTTEEREAKGTKYKPVHPLHGCMQIAQHQQLDIEKPARGASYPVL